MAKCNVAVLRVIPISESYVTPIIGRDAATIDDDTEDTEAKNSNNLDDAQSELDCGQRLAISCSRRERYRFIPSP